MRYACPGNEAPLITLKSQYGNLSTANLPEGDPSTGYYGQPTLLKGDASIRVFQEEIFGPVVGITTLRMKKKPLPMILSTAPAQGSGRGISTALTGWDEQLKPGASGPTVALSIRHMRHLAATKNQASGGKHIK